MSSTVGFLEKLREIGVRVSLADDKLHIQAPRGALTPALRNQLQERGNEVARYLRDVLDSSSKLPPIKQAIATESPLGYNQHHIWHKHEASTNKARFNVSAVVELNGVLDLQCLQHAFDQVIEKHPALRTVLLEASGKPHQRTGQVRQHIMDELVVPIGRHDLRDTLIAQREAILRQALTFAANQPFDLMLGPLVRAELFHTADKQYTLLLTVHQAMIDTRSLTLVMQDWATFYNAQKAGVTVDSQLASKLTADDDTRQLPALTEQAPNATSDGLTLLDTPETVNYPAYVAWQRWPGIFERQMVYWREQLADEPTMCRLPTDNPRPKVQSDIGARTTLLLDKELQNGLHALSERLGVTLSMTLLAAFKLVLARISGQDEIVVGSMMAARTQVALADVVGYVENTVILRTDVRDEPSFNQLLRRVAQVVIGARANQDVPFSQMLGALRAEGNLSHASLMQVYFNMLQPQGNPLPLHGMTSKRKSLPQPNVLFDLTLNVSDEADGILLEAVYRKELFRPERVDMLLRQLEFVLMQAVVATNRPIAAFSLNPGPPTIPTYFPQDYELIPNQLAKIATQHGSKLAVADADFQFTYSEINTKANQVANYLHDRGIVPGEHVAVVATRNASLLPVVMGVLRAGAVLALVDANEQTTVLVNQLAEIQPAAVIVPQEAEPLPVMLEHCLEEVEFRLRYPVDEGLPANSAEPPAITIRQDAPAFIAFSKEMRERLPVVMSHRSLAHLFTWQQERFKFQASDRFSMLSPLGDDTLLRELLTPMLAGGLLLVPENETVADTSLLLQWLAVNRITVGQFSLTQVEQMAQKLPLVEKLPVLNSLLIHAPNLQESLVRQLRRSLPRATYIQLYGSAETALIGGYQVIPAAGLLLENDIIPLGSGIGEFELLVLNEHGQLAGVGELGEIFVRSPYLAEGYLNRPKLTATHFVMSRRFGRMWRTRDFARVRPDGLIEYVTA